MSSEIKDTAIYLTRGDSLEIKVDLFRDNGDAYTPVEGDVIRFALKHTDMDLKKADYKDPQPLIMKTIPNDTLLLKLEPEDTKPMAFGKYVYDMEITFSSGFVDTFITEAPFYITPEVH